MKKRIVLIVISFICMGSVFSQQVEKLLESKEAVFTSDGPYEAYRGIYVDEVSNTLEIIKGRGIGGAKFFLDDNSYGGMVETVAVMSGMYYFKTGDVIFSSSGSAVAMQKDKKVIVDTHKNIKNGINFILKKDAGYIVYYVDEKGLPGAVDTTGKIYTNIEAISYLEENDPEKYEASKNRAIEIGLGSSFEKKEVLVWGETYYSTVSILDEFWKPEYSLYVNLSYPIQYDLQGNGYMANFRYEGEYSKVVIVSSEGIRTHEIDICAPSTILSNTIGGGFSESMYVGFGGNIYYYIASSRAGYTEVFRIRRTWGNPDNYALAINGYTEDSYGTYVTETLASMTKAELRLLRNTIFALYGYHFNSADLKEYFEKQVWYIDEGKTISDIELPEHRQKLLELIQEEESKR